MISLDLQGLAEVTQRLQRLQRPQAHVLGEALYREGNDIMGRSVTLVPVDTGLLRSSAHVERPIEQGPIVSVTMSYGSNGLVPYAAIVEFDVTMNHPHGGQSHFFQQAVFEATPGFPQRIAQAIAPALRQP